MPPVTFSFELLCTDSLYYPVKEFYAYKRRRQQLKLKFTFYKKNNFDFVHFPPSQLSNTMKYLHALLQLFHLFAALHFIDVLRADDVTTTTSETFLPPPLTGGLKAIATNNSILLEAITAVQPAMHAHLSTISPYAHRLGQITEAYSQVVAGLKFYISLQMTQTDCLRSNVTDSPPVTSTAAEVAPTAINGNINQPNNCTATMNRTCQAEIWVQSWLNSNELLAFNCPDRVIPYSEQISSSLVSEASSPVPAPVPSE